MKNVYAYPWLILPLMAAASAPLLAQAPTGSSFQDTGKRRTPRLAMKIDLMRPLVINGYNLVPLSGTPVFRWPVFISSEIGITRQVSTEISLHRNGGIRNKRVEGMVGQLRWYFDPPEALGTWELKPYAGPMLNYRTLHDTRNLNGASVNMGGAGLGGGVTCGAATGAIRPVVDLYTGVFYQKRLSVNQSYHGYYYAIGPPEDKLFSLDFFANRINYDVRIGLGVQF